MAAAAEMVAALVAPWEAAAAVLGVVASARTVVSLEARWVAAAMAAVVVKVVATAATAARAAEAATAVGMEGKMASRTPRIDHLHTNCNCTELLCTGCWYPRYSTMHSVELFRSSRMACR